MKRTQGWALVIAAGMASSAHAQCESAKAAPTDGTPRVMHASYVTETGERDIVDTAVAAGNFKTLAAALKAAGLVETLKGKGPFTVFAPTDEAFAKLPPGTIDTLLKPENKGMLTAILTYHVIPGAVQAKDVVKLTFAGSVNGQRIDIAVKGGQVMLDGRSKVTATDIACTNGVIHVIDTVIMPSTRDAIQTAAEAGSFKTLLAAVEAAGLTEALRGKGPFTIFAPSDEAFAKLPAGTVENLLKQENRDQLKAILGFHVVPARVYASDIGARSTSGKTLQGTSFRIDAAKGKVRIGNDRGMAEVVATDIETSNGVIHVIDTVIMPE